MKTPPNSSRRISGCRSAIKGRYDGYSITRLHSELARLSPEFRGAVDDGRGPRHSRVAGLTRSDTLRAIWAVLDTMPASRLRDLATDLEKVDRVFGNAAVSGNVTR